MKLPTTMKKIQSLTGRPPTLNRFLSRSTEKCKPFFNALKKGQGDKWDKECEASFQDLKAYLTSPLIPSFNHRLFFRFILRVLVLRELVVQHYMPFETSMSNVCGLGVLTTYISVIKGARYLDSPGEQVANSYQPSIQFLLKINHI
ncbi:hypothetical protein L3X38_011441 [Prunus dulcis]|uniref:Reverse transcriptase/retrotransposon-derived protein RNase H-like domain-containing protein n=1 Tax=Prunus dulcis TaxID=3755 RepID=A0AAD4WHE0_PRUDU|nr:hypothetical protein L3X38_011441 [Prunus dulcis]